MVKRDIFAEATIYEVFRQTINAIIEVANADGNATELAAIVTKLETLKDDLMYEESAGRQMPADTFPEEAP